MPAQKPYWLWFLFTHKNSDFSGISVTERSCAAPIAEVESHISDRCSYLVSGIERFSLDCRKGLVLVLVLVLLRPLVG